MARAPEPSRRTRNGPIVTARSYQRNTRRSARRPYRAELRRMAGVDRRARRQQRLATVRLHQLERPALVAVAAVAVGVAVQQAVADLRRARHAVPGYRAQLVERAHGLRVLSRARLVGEVAGEEPDARCLIGAGRVVAAQHRAVAVGRRGIGIAEPVAVGAAVRAPRAGISDLLATGPEHGTQNDERREQNEAVPHERAHPIGGWDQRQPQRVASRTSVVFRAIAPTTRGLSGAGPPPGRATPPG